MDRLDRKDLKHAPFDVALRGYDKRQVDERIRFLGAELAAAEDALRAAQARIAALEEELGQVRSGPGADAGFGARVEKILATAEEEARAVRNQAGIHAAVLVEQAKTEAEEQRRRAEQEIAARQAETDRAGAAVAQEVEQLRRTAAQEADEVRRKARAQAAQRIQEARIEADRLVASANEAAGQRERASVQELQRLSQLRDQVNTELYRAKNVLDSLFPGTANDATAAAERDGRVSRR